MFGAVQRKLDSLNQVLQENLAGVRVVKAFVRTEHENARFARANDELTQENIGVTQLVAMLLPTMQFVVNLGIVGRRLVRRQPGLAGRLCSGQDGGLDQLHVSLSVPAADAGRDDRPAFRGGRVGGAHPGGAGQRARGQGPGTRRARNRTKRTGRRGESPLKSVSFRYNGHEQEAVLKDVNLVAEPGETVALLGATGSGKSRLVHLIPRFYDVTEGRVTLDGVDVRDLSLGHAARPDRRRPAGGGAVYRHDPRQHSLRAPRGDRGGGDRGRPGRPGARLYHRPAPTATTRMVGQRGVNLSGGQKQRIAIARALLVQPTVLILDDSTSAVDVETEAKIQDALEELMQGRTSFVIAQRISTVLNADKIVVLDRGQIAAEGTHAELLARSPIYREIYRVAVGRGRRTEWLNRRDGPTRDRQHTARTNVRQGCSPGRGCRGRAGEAARRASNGPRMCAAHCAGSCSTCAPYRWAFAAVFALVIVSTLLGLLAPYLMGLAIDRLLARDASGGTDAAGLARVSLGMLAAYAGAWLARVGQSVLVARVSQKAMRDLRRDLFEHLQTLSLRFFDRHPHGELMSRLTNDLDAINRVLSQNVIDLFSGLLTLVGRGDHDVCPQLLAGPGVDDRPAADDVVRGLCGQAHAAAASASSRCAWGS